MSTTQMSLLDIFMDQEDDIKEKIKSFKNRELKANKLFTIKDVSKKESYEFVKKYHYLADAKFFSKEQVGLFIGHELVGVATYSNPQGISALKSWFGMDNTEQLVVELSRLAMKPELNRSNATSFLLSNSIKLLKSKGYKAVITLADSSRHNGAIYQVCNFKYYGLTDSKSDFYRVDGKVNARGSTKGVDGVWLPRTRKHRYAFVLDKELKCLYEERVKPKTTDTFEKHCCGGSNVVEDNRSGKVYKCPLCSIEDFQKIGLEEVE